MSSCGIGRREGVTDSCDSWVSHMPSSDTNFQNPVSTKIILSSFTQISDLVACDSWCPANIDHTWLQYVAK